jgi:hypothetical protein
LVLLDAEAVHMVTVVSTESKNIYIYRKVVFMFLTVPIKERIHASTRNGKDDEKRALSLMFYKMYWVLQDYELLVARGQRELTEATMS